MLKWQRKILRRVVEKVTGRDGNELRNKLERSALYAFLVKMTPVCLFALDKIEKVYIEVSSACTLKCTLCPVGNSLIKPKLIDLTTYKKIVDLLPKSVWVVNYAFRGEPFVNPHFPAMVKYTHDKGIFTIASTNGMLVDKYINELIESGLDRLYFAIDGPTQEIQEKYRVGSNLEKIINALKMLAQARKKTGARFPREILVQTVVSSFNEDYLDKMEQMAREAGADGIVFKTLACSFGGNYLKGKEVNLAHVPKNPEFIRKRDMQLCPKACHIGILYNGDVTTCVNDYLTKNITGNLFQTGTFEKLCYSLAFSRLRKKMRLKQLVLCELCPATGNFLVPNLSKMFK